jgi:hypothetical protein
MAETLTLEFKIDKHKGAGAALAGLTPVGYQLVEINRKGTTVHATYVKGEEENA